MANQFIDALCINIQLALHTLSGVEHSSQRKNPTQELGEKDSTVLSEQSKRHVGALMRINHTGEVCAQALYQGQALFARNKHLQESMKAAAVEELDHLNWCKKRLNELNTHTSYLNLLWYTGSLSLGLLASLTPLKYNLGFLAETENQVTQHLKENLNEIPKKDKKTTAILEQMIIDEQNHATSAIAQGGVALPKLIKQTMSVMAQAMKSIAYYI